MATWHELGEENRRAAQSLFRDGMYRSSMSRSNYAAYAALTHHLCGRTVFPQGRGNPPHAILAGYVQSVLTDLPPFVVRDIKHKVRTLYKACVAADYLPADSCDERAALHALRAAAAIIEQLPR